MNFSDRIAYTFSLSDDKDGTSPITVHPQVQLPRRIKYMEGKTGKEVPDPSCHGWPKPEPARPAHSGADGVFVLEPVPWEDSYVAPSDQHVLSSEDMSEEQQSQNLMAEVHDLEHQIVGLDNEMADLQKRLQDLRTRRRTAWSKLYTKRATYAPVARLSDDVLALIFEATKDEEAKDWTLPVRRLPPQVVMSHVCRRWRVVSKRLPVLWRSIIINSPNDLDKAESWLSSVRSSTFDITVRGLDKDKAGWSRLQELLERAVHVPSTVRSVGCEHFQTFLLDNLGGSDNDLVTMELDISSCENFLGHCLRPKRFEWPEVARSSLRSLQLALGPPELRSHPSYLDFQSLSSLVELEIRLPETYLQSHVSEASFFRMLRSCPTLIILKIKNLQFEPQGEQMAQLDVGETSEVPLALQHLDLHFFDRTLDDCAMSSQSFTALLRLCPALLSLKLSNLRLKEDVDEEDDDGVEEHGPSLELLTLETLQNKDCHTPPDWMRFILAPHLKSLHLSGAEGQWPDPFESLADLFVATPCLATLQRLSFECEDSEDIVRILERVPNIERLDLSVDWDAVDLMTALSAEKDGLMSLIPKLSILGLNIEASSEEISLTMKALRVLIMTRAGSATPIRKTILNTENVVLGELVWFLEQGFQISSSGLGKPMTIAMDGEATEAE